MFADSFKKLATENNNFRQVLHTGANSQVVAMSLPAGVDIGEEVHGGTDQIFFVAEGSGRALVGDDTRDIGADDIVFVPAGLKHNVTNNGDQDLKLITIYAPPEHADGTIHATKEEAEASEA